MISVIIPVYNVEKYLNNCVKSVIGQSYKDLEIILVDDGSTDNSGIICDFLKEKDNRIIVIHKKNGGLSSARNAGLSIASGDYILFIDSDDTIDSNMIKVMYNTLIKNNSDIVICDYQRIKNEEPKVCDINNFKVENMNYDDLWVEIFGHLNNSSCNKMYRKDLMNNIFFKEGIIHGEDLLFNLDYLSNCKKGTKINCKFYHYYIRENSITKAAFNKNNFNEILVKDFALEIIKNRYPSQIKNAQKFCFRARMNVLRSIYKSNYESEYQEEVDTLKSYIKKNYSNVKNNLKFKEKVEFFLFFNLKKLYKEMIKFVG